MKSIWHTPDEIPRFGSGIVIRSKDKFTGICWTGLTPWKELAKVNHIFRWAYVKDMVGLDSKLETAVKALKEIVDSNYWNGVFCGIPNNKELQIAETALKDIGE